MDKASVRSPSTPLLEVEGLTVEFRSRHGAITAVRDVSYSLGAGESLAILGESGSGKTVSSRAILGLLPPSGRVVSGSVRFAGEGVELLPRRGAATRITGREVAMVFQDALTALNPVFSVGWQIAEVLRIHNGASRRQARREAVETMQRVGIPDAARRFDAYPHEFSGGMRQRMMIAIALALDPQVLIADEPTTALDVTVQAQIMQLLEDLRAETGMALVLITHDLGVVADVADRVLVMYAGRVVESGSVGDVYGNPAHPYTDGLISSSPLVNERVERLVQIPGAPPQPSALPSGCPFHVRCPMVADQCREERPPLEPVGDGRSSACHFSWELLNG